MSKISVTELNDIIKNKVTSILPKETILIGEVYDFKMSNSHWYFQLKDNNCTIKSNNDDYYYYKYNYYFIILLLKFHLQL